MNPFQTYKDKNINVISEQLQKHLEKNAIPAKGKIEYKLLNGTLDINPELKTEEERLKYPSLTQIHLSTKVKDPGNGGKVVEIGIVKDFDEQGRPIYDKLFVMGAEKGKLFFHDDVMGHGEIAALLELHQQNESNPFRDKSIKPLFKKIDRLKDAQDEKALSDKLFKSLQAIDLMTNEDKRLIHAASGGNYHDEDILVEASLTKLAKKDPEGFYKLADSPLTKIKALVKQAEESNIIQFDAQHYKYIWVKSKETIATLERIEGEPTLSQMAEYINTHKEGGKIQKQIETMLKSK
jgi:hypothetical protein